MAMIRAAYYQLQFVRQLYPFLEKEDLTMVTHALLMSQPDYCNVLYTVLSLKMTKKLQLVQNTAAHMMAGVTSHQHIICFAGESLAPN